jgi:hypothetical protein
MRQKASFEQELQARMSFLSGKGIKSPKADKDTLVRKLQADIKAVNRRLRLHADNEKRTEDIAKIKAAKAAAPQKEQEGGKGEKPKKAPEAGKGKKIKPEGGKSQKTTESSEEDKATMKKVV